MPLNPLFWAVVGLLAAAAAIVWTLRRARHRASEQSPSRKGGGPGYSRADADRLSVNDTTVELEGGQWRARALETYHSETRSRLILRLELQAGGAEAIADFLGRLARELQTRTEANVVYLQAERDAQSFLFLYAADGLGWSGRERVREAISGPDLEADLR